MNPFSNPLINLFLNKRDQVSHPYKTTGRLPLTAVLIRRSTQKINLCITVLYWSWLTVVPLSSSIGQGVLCTFLLRCLSVLPVQQNVFQTRGNSLQARGVTNGKHSLSIQAASPQQARYCISQYISLSTLADNSMKPCL